MSNIIRFRPFSPSEKKVIQTKKVERKKPNYPGLEIEPAHQQHLLQEVKALEARYSELKSQLQKEQEEAQAAIQQWWKEKQEEAEQTAQRLAAEATAQGYQDGLAQGTLQAEEEFRQQRQEMNELIRTAYEEKARIIQQSEPFLLSLSVKVAEKVIKAELTQHNGQLLNVVKQALQQIEESEDVVIQVSPEDYPSILPFLEELDTYVRADSELKLIPVAALARGDCLIHTAGGSHDVTVDSQLQEIKKHMLAYCEEKTNDEAKGR